jgi:anti-sigma factor RsiW
MSPLSEEDRENLVAYLDGELDEETSRTVEARLNTDPQLRAEAEALKQAWEMLDYLPRPEPSTTFTHRTMERLTLHRPISTMTMAAGRHGNWLAVLGWALALLLAGATGFALAVWLGPKPPVSADNLQVEDVLVEDLRVIENKHLYDSLEDLDFLKELDQPDLFGDGTP